MPIMVNVNNEDMRNIRIACRCGEKFVTSVPEPLSGTVTLTLCPKCRRPFGIQKQGESWKIKAIEPGEFRGTTAVREDQLDEIKKVMKDMEKDSSDKTDDTDTKPFVN